jgi:hypothetical protein
MSDTKNPDHNQGVAMVRALMLNDKERCGTQEKLEALTGVDQSSWSLYLGGHAKPRKLAREAIRRKLKIPVDSWDNPVHAPMNVHSDAPVTSQAVDASAEVA